MFTILAHSGETHDSTLAATIHSGLSWYWQIIIFIAVTATTSTLIWLVTKKISTTLLTVATLMLIAGFGLFQVAPIISVLSITFGLIATLASTLAGLSTKE